MYQTLDNRVSVLCCKYTIHALNNSSDMIDQVLSFDFLHYKLIITCVDKKALYSYKNA